MLENQLAESISLNGTWEIEIAGTKGDIRVPGAWEAQGYPFSAGVTDPVIYRRSFDVPAEWQGADLWLRFGAVSYYAEVFVNGAAIGSHEGLWTPFAFDVTGAIRCGDANQLEVRVIKPGRAGDRFPYRDVLVGFLPYVFDTFGGIWQDVTLVAQRAPAFDAQVFPHIDGTVIARAAGRFRAEILDPDGGSVARADGADEIALQVAAPRLWPSSLYTLRLTRDGAQADLRFGFRDLRAEGDQLKLNGAPIFLRGVLSWGWDENTLAPRPSDDDVRAEFRRVRAAGFNLYKLCLYVPTENVFRIADEEGMLLWLELPLWLPNLSDHLRQQARIEYADILRSVQHHPSLVIYSLGCELSAANADAALLEQLDSLARGATCGALVCDNSGSGEAYGGLAHDFADFSDYHFYCDLHQFTPLCDHFRRDWRPARPLIFGEFCDSDDYRDPTELLVDGQRPRWREFMGVEGNPQRWAYGDQEERIAALDLPLGHAEIERLSRRQSLLVRKQIVETLRARRDIGGCVITGLRDTPISTSGVFDDLGRFKYGDRFREFNADALLLLESGRARRWTHGGDRPDPIDRFNHVGGERVSLRALLANHAAPIRDPVFAWHVTAPDGTVIAARQEPLSGLFAPGLPRELALVEFSAPPVDQALCCRLTFTLTGAEIALQNSWPLWIYPAVAFADAALYDPAGALDGFEPIPRSPSLDPAQVMIAGGCSREIVEFVRAGGRALVLQYASGTLPVERVPFWRESIKLFYDHPALRAFPHEGFADLQFYSLATDAAFDLAGVARLIEGGVVTPILRRLDARLFTALEYLAGVELGAGRMLISTLRFQGGAGDQVRGLRANVAGQFLLRQMIDALG